MHALQKGSYGHEDRKEPRAADVLLKDDGIKVHVIFSKSITHNIDYQRFDFGFIASRLNSFLRIHIILIFMKDFNEEINEDELYSVLPAQSNGRQADNSLTFAEFLHPKVIKKSAFPYAIVCYDEILENYTWHLFCDRIDLLDLINPELRKNVENHISFVRRRSLKCIEVYVRNRGYFIL